MNVNSRLTFPAATAALLLGTMMPQNANATSEEQLKDLQNQVALLQQQIQLVNLQQTQAATQQTAVVTALKNQVSAQSDLEKAMAQGAFAKLAGIKAGLDSVGAPVSKDGTITVSAGTAGATLLSLRKPMLEGLESSAKKIAEAVKAKSPAVYVGTDAQVQAALQASVIEKSLMQSITALDASTKAVQDKIGGKVTAAFFTEAAAVGLVLNTVVGLDKFFRVDTTYTVSDAGDEAQQTLMLMVQQKLGAAAYRNLAAVSISVIMKQAETAQEALLAVKQRYDAGAAVAIEVVKMKADDPRRPAQDVIDRLNSDLAAAKASLDALHPALKPEGFWGYVQGLTARQQMREGEKYIPRLVVQAKAQTIQVVEKRTWRSDKIFGRSDIQIDYRLIDSDGNLLDSGLTLATFDAADSPIAGPIYSFPPQQTNQAAQQPKQ